MSIASCASFQGIDFPTPACAGGGFCTFVLSNPEYETCRGWSGSAGGQSYSAGLLNATIMTAVGNSRYSQYIPNANWPQYIALSAASDNHGLLLINWSGANPSASATISPTRLPSSSTTQTLSSSSTRSGTSGATRSMTATPTTSVHCLPSAYAHHVQMDLLGSWAANSTLVSSVRACELMCCETPACNAYTVNSALLQLLGQTLCYQLNNVTMLVPDNDKTSGIRGGNL